MKDISQRIILLSDNIPCYACLNDSQLWPFVIILTNIKYDVYLHIFVPFVYSCILTLWWKWKKIRFLLSIKHNDSISQLYKYNFCNLPIISRYYFIDLMNEIWFLLLSRIQYGSIVIIKNSRSRFKLILTF